MFSRILNAPDETFFLFGPRSTGKSTWVKTHFKGVFLIDLLRNEQYLPLLKRPEQLREQVAGAVKPGGWVVIDEVQRIPALLNEVHSLIEDEGYRFVLTGSSARKLKKGQANLLAGRALVKHFFPLTRGEFGEKGNILDILRFGSLPAILENPKSRIDRLDAYAGTYLREEIKEEALTRNIENFSRFLDIAAIAHGQVTNLSNISRDAMVSRSTVGTYFEILSDTLIGSFLPAWMPRARVKEVQHPKFYFFDCGVVRALQGRLRDEPIPEEQGILLETYILHELRAWIAYSGCGGELFYWRTADDVEIDFIWKRGKNIVAIEVKSNRQWKSSFEKGLKAFSDHESEPQSKWGVYLGTVKLKNRYSTILPVTDFLQALYAGKVIG